MKSLSLHRKLCSSTSGLRKGRILLFSHFTFINNVQRIGTQRHYHVSATCSKGLSSRRYFTTDGTGGDNVSSIDNIIIPLQQRSFYRVEGRDTFKFLQGIITNDINLFDDGRRCIASAVLNPKGRVVSDIFIYNTTKLDDEHHSVLIEVFTRQSAALLQYLTLYKLRSKIKIMKQEDCKCYFSPSPMKIVNKMIGNTGEDQSAVVVASDPRVEGFGCRILVHKSKGDDKSLVLSGACSVASPALYNTYRTLWGLGEGSELEGKIPLEMNMDLTNYISFSKGCYLGQELTARTKYKGVVRKRLLPFIVSDTNAVRVDATKVLPRMSSIFGNNTYPHSENGFPLFPTMSPGDRGYLLSYLKECEKKLPPYESRTTQSVNHEIDDSVVHWKDFDELNQWTKLRIIQSSISENESKTPEKVIGKILCIDGAYNQDVYRIGLGLVNLSSLTAGDESRIFSVLNEDRRGWKPMLQVLRPPWWQDIDPVTDKPLISD